ncbi:MAG: hypothetical protein Q8P93_00190, partial [bacterium]|nr:hypothetical protein [bacterium]
MNKNILIGIMVGATILITGWYVSVLNTPVAFEMVPPPDVNTNTHLQITADEEHEQIDVVEPPAVTQFDWSTFISDAGFQFQYPSTWQVTDNLS